MREVDITERCLSFIDGQEQGVLSKFHYLIEIIGDEKVVHPDFVEKLKDTGFYGLRIRVGSEYRVLVFAIDHLNFSGCKKVVCLNGFVEKSDEDCVKAIGEARKILKAYVRGKQLCG